MSPPRHRHDWLESTIAWDVCGLRTLLFACRTCPRSKLVKEQAETMEMAPTSYDELIVEA